MEADALQVIAVVAAAVTPVIAALAARWGSNAGVRAALRSLRGEVADVRAATVRAHERIDSLYEARG